MRSISGASKGPKKSSFTYRMFHLSGFWENGSFMNKKKGRVKKRNEKINFTSLSLSISQGLFKL